MRVALVSPYDWSLPGGVNRHVAGLAADLRSRGHAVTILAPGAGDADGFVGLGRTVGLPFNGARSNVTLSPAASARLRSVLRAGDFDVVHLHEPVAVVGHRRAIGLSDAPVVGTFHAHSDRWLPHAFAAATGTRRLFNRLHVRIAVSEPAAWTGRRFFGGEYRIVPNGVELPAGGVPAPRRLAPGAPLEIAFVGQAVERKGLPVLLRAFEALREHVPARLRIAGAEPAELDPLILDRRGIEVLGRIDDDAKARLLASAHVLCAPSLGGESFGMVLTEAFAAGTPVVASDIAGYRDVVTDGRDGVLVAPGDAEGLAVALRDLAGDPELLERLAGGARDSAERYAWPRVTDEVLAAYEDAIAMPKPATVAARAAVREGLRPSDGGPRRPARRMPPLDPRSRDPRAARRRVGLAAGLLATVAGAAVGLHHLGWHAVAAAILASSPPWVLAAVALMVTSMFVRAISWHAILRAAPATSGARLADAAQGTAIGVLMSATLPARLGELSRALTVARRLGRPRHLLVPVLGTMVTQTALNAMALVVLGAVVTGSTGVLAGHHLSLLAYAVAPVAIVAVVVVAPALVRGGGRSRVSRALAGVSTQLRSGLSILRRPVLAAVAAGAQGTAWALQWLACLVLLHAVGVEQAGAGAAAAAAVLFAVNVTAALPVTPSNIGVFQAACVAVLTSAYHVPTADALGYGVVLQAVELATAIVVGGPALLREGATWREVRMRALHAAPIRLTPAPPSGLAPDA